MSEAGTQTWVELDDFDNGNVSEQEPDDDALGTTCTPSPVLPVRYKQDQYGERKEFRTKHEDLRLQYDVVDNIPFAQQ